MSARAILREATGGDHEAVDALYANFDLSDIASYGRFLRAQSRCVAVIEDALADSAERLLGDWASRARAHLIAIDLAELGLSSGAAMARPDFPDDAAVLGAVYVLEGSRFGGAVLARQLPRGAPARYLTGGNEPGSWRAFLSVLDRHLGDDATLDSAVRAAKAVFHSFETAGRQEMERPVASRV